MTDAAVFQVASKSMAKNAWTSASVALWTANSIMASIDKNKTGKGFLYSIRNFTGKRCSRHYI